MLCRSLERGGASGVRAGPSGRVPHPRGDFPNGRTGLAVQDPDGDEARRHQDGQAREADDADRGVQRAVHRACADRPRLPLLRAVLLRPVDADVERGDVLEAGQPVLDPLPHPGAGRRLQTELHRLHDQVPDGPHRRHHLQLLGLEQQDPHQLDQVREPAARKAERGVRLSGRDRPPRDRSRDPVGLPHRPSRRDAVRPLPL